MNNLYKGDITGFIPSNVHRDNYSIVRTDSYTDEPTYMRYMHDMKRTPFTVKFLEDNGHIYMYLLPGLTIDKIRFHNITDNTYSDYYMYYADLTEIMSPSYDANDEVQIEITWKNNYIENEAVVRSLGYHTHYDDSIDPIGSQICFDCRVEVYGNLGSLLLNSDDCGWMYDIYKAYNSQNKKLTLNFDYAFFGLFVGYSLTKYSDDNYIVVDTDDRLFNCGPYIATNLYLPRIPGFYVYADLFNKCSDMILGPRYIYVDDWDGYCQRMLYKCDLLRDYQVYVDMPSTIRSHDVMTQMFSSAGIIDHIWFNYRNYDLLNQNSAVDNIIHNAYITLIDVPPTDDNNIIIDHNVIMGDETAPCIYVYNFCDKMQEDATFDPNEYLESLLNKVQSSEYLDFRYGLKYIFDGTIFCYNDARSYYVWKLDDEYYKIHSDVVTNNDVGGFNLEDSSTEPPYYILTAEKDFRGMTVLETNKPMCRPVKYVSNETSINADFYESCVKVDRSYKLSNICIVKQSAAVPIPDCGIPEVYIDDSIDMFFEMGRNDITDDDIKYAIDHRYLHDKNDMFRLYTIIQQTDGI